MDLSTKYCGLSLWNPLVAAASPLTRTLDGIRRLEDSGIGAIVLPSLFEEQIEEQAQHLEHLLAYGAESYAEALSYLPKSGLNFIGPEEYLETIEQAKKTVDVPIIASLNGVSIGGWMRYARLIQQAGADAIELNVYFLATDQAQSGEVVEEEYLRIIRTVVQQVELPVTVKLAPYFTSLPNIAQQLANSHVRGIVLFNRFYQPDFDLENLDVVPSLALSRSEDMRLPLRWTAILHGVTELDIAISTGVHTYADVLKGVMAGASVTMLASELLQNGTDRVGEILREMRQWMEEKEYASLAQMRGSMSQPNVSNPAAIERANYMTVLYSQKYIMA
jgi:dihydroorotate dehydrogenase (fumarate)